MATDSSNGCFAAMQKFVFIGRYWPLIALGTLNKGNMLFYERGVVMISWLIRLALLCIACCMLSTMVVAAQLPQLAGIYSNLSLNKESGDLLGMEILLVPEGEMGKYQAVVQLAEGGLPQVAIANVQVKQNAFSFEFMTASDLPAIKFQCTFKGMTLECSTGESKETLRRGKSYWQ